MPTAVFDMLGTFFALDPLRQRLSAVGAPEHALDLWLSDSLRDHQALSLAGAYRPLFEVLAEALPRTLTQLGRPVPEPSRLELVLKGFRTLNPVEGATAACDALTDAGFRIVALSNTAEEHTRALLDRAGLLSRFDAVLSADAANAAKPDVRAYRLVHPRAEGETWMISAHGWDLMGARRAGLKSAWLSKTERRWLGVFPFPEVEAQDLRALVGAVIARGAQGEAAAPA